MLLRAPFDATSQRQLRTEALIPIPAMYRLELSGGRASVTHGIHHTHVAEEALECMQKSVLFPNDPARKTLIQRWPIAFA